MRALLFLFCALSASAADTIEVFGQKWTVPFASDWAIEKDGGAQILTMLKNRGPAERPDKPRRPFQFAVAETALFRSVALEADVKRADGKSLILVFAWRDDAHFNYAHLSEDTGTQQPVHNGIFHVFGGERVRISRQEGPGALPKEKEWYHVKLMWDGSTGIVNVMVNGTPIPALEAVDLSLSSGRVGLGSFDNRAAFRNVKITSTPAKESRRH